MRKTDKIMVTSKYFKESEFQKCSPACSLQDMNQSTMNRFDTARDIAGIPLVITSAYRSVEHERKQGRAGTSSHTLGHAIDIRCNTDGNRFKVIDAILKAGFRRIGIARTYIHADDSRKHTPEVSWMYK
jgi:hypothetical protein